MTHSIFRLVTIMAGILLGDFALAADQTPPATQPPAADKSAKSPRQKVLINGETLELHGKPAFVMHPADEITTAGKPWIFYGPTLPPYPDEAERWMHEQFLGAGIAVAGIDVGEAYGSPLAFPAFEALYQEMIRRGFSKKPVLLGRSRGGLWVSSWAIRHPERVSGIAGIYPVYDFTTYPGMKRAAGAYGLSEDELAARQAELNPVRRASVLAEAKIPVLIIHGKEDTVVPLKENSEAVEKIYADAGVADLIQVIKIDGQGHNFWPGFFHCEELVQFVIRSAKTGAVSE
ncbi:MAG: prolyl oligopeptidase family serine peptidase [Planctomycetaceae bacterium]